MLTFTWIGPGRQDGNFYAGYFHPSRPREFVPLVDCNTRAQAKAAVAELEREAQQREHETFDKPRQPREFRPIYGFYDDNEMI